MNMGDQLHRPTWQLRHRGHDARAAAGLGCDHTVARVMAQQYLLDAESRAQQHRFSLFDL
jgi:hypothetical protein